MASISTTLQIIDNMTPVIGTISSALRASTELFEMFGATVTNAADAEKFQSKINTFKGAISSLDEQWQKLGATLAETTRKQENFNKSAGVAGSMSGSSAFQGIMGANIVQKVAGMVTSQVGSAISRLDTINGFPSVMANLGISADQASAAMDVMKNKLSGLPTTLNDAVSSVQRLTAVNGNVGASTKIFLALNNAILAGGANTVTQQAALEQLSQAYAKGKPDMTEWRSAMTAMPAQLNQIAKAMGKVDATALGDDLRLGKTSMQEFMNTIVELNENGIDGFLSFEEQARNSTSGMQTAIANMNAAITRGITNVITSINAGLESSGADNIQSMIQNFGNAVENTLTQVGKLIGFLAPLTPLLKGIVAVVIGYTAALAAFNIQQGICNTLEAFSIAAKAQLTGTTLAQAAALTTATGAQVGLNAALLACPITWIVLGIVGIVTALIAFCSQLNKSTEAAQTWVGFMIGTFSVLGAIISNIVIGLINEVIQLVWTRFAEPFIGIVEFILNCANGGFDNFGEAVKNLIGNVISWFLSLGTVVTKIIDAIFGTDWTSGLTKLQNQVLSWGKNDNAITLSRTAPIQIDRFNYTEEFAKGAKSGDKLAEMLGITSQDSIIDKNDAILDVLDNISSDTSSLSDSVSATEDELKYLRDIAEREVINRYTTAEIRVEMTNNNTVNSNMDLEEMGDALADILYEQSVIAAEGVYT